MCNAQNRTLFAQKLGNESAQFLCVSFVKFFVENRIVH